MSYINRVRCYIIIFSTIVVQLFAQETDYKCFNEFTYDAASLLKIPAERRSLIMLGNSHGVSGDFSIIFELVKYLNNTNAVRYILIERSYADALLINLYLQTGNIEFMKYDPEWSGDMKYFIEGVYQFNQNIPADKNISFLGVDGVRAITPVVLAIQKLMPEDKTPNPLIRNFIDSLKGIDIPIKKIKAYKSAQERLEEIESMIIFFRKEVYRNEVHYQDFFGANYVHINQIISNVATLKKQNRNFDMYQNSLRIIRHLKINEPMFGIFGSLHVAAISKLNLASLLQNHEESPFKGNVVKVCLAYTNCQSAFEYNGDHEAFSAGIKSIDKVKLIKRTNCEDFFMRISKTKDFESYKDLFDYVIHVTNRGPIKFLK